MKPLNLKDITLYVEENIGTFHEKRIASLNTLILSKVLKRKNPYLFKAKHVLTSEAIVRGLVDAHISSSEETIFGDWLEGLAIFINNKIYGGQKSTTKGIDLEFNREGIRYIVNIKSGPNWGNSSQIKKMEEDFKTAQRTLRTSGSNLNITCVNGCCYGTNGTEDKGNYYKYCGQKFWQFISGNENLYTDIIEPLGHKACEKNESFMESYSKRINVFTKEFGEMFCDDRGAINWEELVKFNSSQSPAKVKNKK